MNQTKTKTWQNSLPAQEIKIYENVSTPLELEAYKQRETLRFV